jgi:protein involved in polysaccharide export with SLBB domain/capsular polysaccharide biosynthesis protein
MSEDYPNMGGTVRRRPRPSHQRPHSNHSNGNGDPGVNGSAYRKNGDATDTDPGTYRNGNHRDDDFQRSRSRQKPWEEPRPRPALSYNNLPDEDEPGFKLPFDPWRLLDAVKRNIGLIITGATLAGIIGFILATFLVKYTVSIPLMRKTSNAPRLDGGDQFTPREYSDQTIYALMKSGEIVHRVTAQTKTNVLLERLKVTPEQLAKAVSIKPSPNPDFVVLSLKAFGRLGAMVELANVYANEVVDYTREIQQAEASEIHKYLQKKLLEADNRIEELTEDLNKYSKNSFVDFDKETESDVTKLVQLQTELQNKQMALEKVNLQIGVREKQLVNQAPQNSELDKARDELRKMKMTMTEINPLVKAKAMEIEILEKQQQQSPATNTVPTLISSSPLFTSMLDLQAEQPALQKQIGVLTQQITNLQSRLSGRTTDSVAFSIKKAQLQSQKTAREEIAHREAKARLLTDSTLPAFTVYSPATMGSVGFGSRWIKVLILALGAAAVGFVMSLLLAMLAEVMDTTLKTPEDVSRITKLPILATLGDLRKMSASAQVNWAFRTLTLLRGKLIANSDQALVCGIISSTHGEGRSTWVNLMVSAASQRGLRVLTVDTRPNAPTPEAQTPKTEPAKATAETAPKPVPEPAMAATAPDNSVDSVESADTLAEQDNNSIELPAQSDPNLTPSVLSAPDKVAEQLQDPNAQPVVHIPLPGWVWNLERRKQWQKALDYWKQIDNLVIFVELPPAEESEAILLAENLPQVIWLVGSGMPDARESAMQLETLRHARCNLVGAVVNHAPPPVLNVRLARWFIKLTSAIAIVASLHSSPTLNAAEPAPQPELKLTAIKNNSDENRLALSGSAKRKRAAWQQKLTFGPGDIMDVQVYGNPSLTRTNIMVGPDGRINPFPGYIAPEGVVATGLSVEELRDKLDREIDKFFPEAKTIVLPVSYSSKKYYVLGKVNSKGAFVLDRPLTVVEAVARAKGLETGMFQGAELADLSRSFIVRNGQKLHIDFEKLFLEGDLSQNVPIEPNDYLYFASAAVNDIYVLGEVMSPGPIGFVKTATVITAITDRGGYADKAFKKRVLVVRGSLNEPETFVVDTEGILEGHKPDFKLQPRDIVYVSRRPWSYAEDLLDEAASSFIQGAVTTWAGINVGPIIKSRLLPRTRPR